jgi:hypothetical protein
MTAPNLLSSSDQVSQKRPGLISEPPEFMCAVWNAADLTTPRIKVSE